MEHITFAIICWLLCKFDHVTFAREQCVIRDGCQLSLKRMTFNATCDRQSLPTCILTFCKHYNDENVYLLLIVLRLAEIKNDPWRNQCQIIAETQKLVLLLLICWCSYYSRLTDDKRIWFQYLLNLLLITCWSIVPSTLYIICYIS